MRMKADLQIINRSISNQALKTNSRHALFTIGRKPIDPKIPNKGTNQDWNVYLMVNTAIDNKTGTTYQITGRKRKEGKNQQISSNVTVFARCAKEGKATLRFMEPACDLLLFNADPILLKAFLYVLENAPNLPTCSNKLTTLNPVLKRQIQKETTTLTINERKDYPTNEIGFPHTLTKLQIQKLQLKKIDLRIFRLYSLVTLDLSGNVIKSIPAELTTMRSLKELNLANNKIENIPQSFCRNIQFCRQLLQLDLSGNHITRLPNNLTNLSNLMVLQLKENLFSYLPRGMFQKMTKLRSLDISGCSNLRYLPTTFFDTNRLDSLFASGLPKVFRDAPNITLVDTSLLVPSLLDITSRKILSNKFLTRKISDEQNVIPSVLKEYLETIVRCYCRKSCLPSSCVVATLRFPLPDVMSYITRDLVTDITNGVAANFECIFCSKICKTNFVSHNNFS